MSLQQIAPPLVIVSKKNKSKIFMIISFYVYVYDYMILSYYLYFLYNIILFYLHQQLCLAPPHVVVSEKILAIAPVLDSCLVFSAHGSRSCFAMWFRSLSHLMLFWEFNSLSKILSFSEKQVEDHWERLKSAGLDLLSNARLEKNCKKSTKHPTYIFLLAYSHNFRFDSTITSNVQRM